MNASIHNELVVRLQFHDGHIDLLNNSQLQLDVLYDGEARPLLSHSPIGMLSFPFLIASPIFLALR